MANVYCDLTLASGLNDGTSWANAYQGAAGLVTMAAAVSAGDDVWVKNNLTTIGADRTLTFPESPGNPVKVHACKAATSAEPPAQSDLIPGLRTGDSTRAYDQTAGNAPVSITDGNASNDINLDGHAYWYGFVINLDGFIRNRNSPVAGMVFEECHLSGGFGGDASKYVGIGNDGGESTSVCWINCKTTLGTADTNAINIRTSGRFRMYGCEVAGDAGTPVFQGTSPSSAHGEVQVHGCDFSNQTTSIFNITNFTSIRGLIRNTSIGSGAAIVTGTPNGTYHIEAYNVGVNGTLTTNDTNLEMALHTERADTVIETTAVRTGGAQDQESNGFSWALTPIVNYTRETYWPAESPEMGARVDGDGTSKTATIYFAKSDASDYNDDDISVRLIYPSATGLTQHDYANTVMNLLGTPSAVTDDTGSTWGTGANNPQKVEISISPDYHGWVYAVVEVYKTFAASPHTVYIDPKIYIT